MKKLISLLFMALFISFQLRAESLHIGVIEGGSGFASTGHVFILFSQSNYSINPDDIVYEYNLEINTLPKEQLNQMDMLEKIDAFFSSPFKVYRYPLGKYIKRYQEQGRNIRLFKSLLPNEKLKEIRQSVSRDYQIRSSGEYHDYDLTENNCQTLIIDKVLEGASREEKELFSKGLFSTAPFNLTEKLKESRLFLNIPFSIYKYNSFSNVFGGALISIHNRLEHLCDQNLPSPPNDLYENNEMRLEYYSGLIEAMESCDSELGQELWKSHLLKSFFDSRRKLPQNL